MSTSKVQPGWTRPESPIHEGERTCRGASASRERWTAWEGRFIRAYMPDQHREFYSALSLAIALRESRASCRSR